MFMIDTTQLVSNRWVSSLCSCQNTGFKAQYRVVNLGLLSFRTTTQQRHRPDCPLYVEGESTRTHYLSLPLRPFISSVVELTLSTGSRQFLASSTLKYYHVVPRASSSFVKLIWEPLPGFMRSMAQFPPLDSEYVTHIIGTCSMDVTTWFSATESTQSMLLSSLKRLQGMLERRELKPFEKDELGNTALMVWMLFRKIVARLQLRTSHSTYSGS